MTRGRRGGADRDDLTADERVCFQAAYDEGMPAVRCLMDQIGLMGERISAHGQTLPADLRHRTGRP